MSFTIVRNAEIEMMGFAFPDGLPYMVSYSSSQTVLQNYGSCIKP